jgi:hypothetical protein
MRVGSNPLKGANIDGLGKVVLAVVTHLPRLEGYHAKRFEVVQKCFQTMLEGVEMDCSLLVWDNGSYAGFKQWIRDDVKPEVFIESQNLGLTFAKAAIANMLPKDTILCYSDDDMLFYEGWLKPQIDLLAHFPNVSCVTGYPVRTSFRWGNNNTRAWAQANARLEEGRFIPQEWDDDFALSVGRTPAWQREYTKNDKEWRISYKGKQAYATSHHCQFIGYAGRIAEAIKHGSMALESETGFDVELDCLGLRLATTQRLCRHIGNVLETDIGLLKSSSGGTQWQKELAR